MESHFNKSSVSKKRVAHAQCGIKDLGIPTGKRITSVWMVMLCLQILSRIRYKLGYPEKHVIPKSPRRPYFIQLLLGFFGITLFAFSARSRKSNNCLRHTFGIIMLIKDRTASEAGLHLRQYTSVQWSPMSWNPSFFRSLPALLRYQHAQADTRR